MPNTTRAWVHRGEGLVDTVALGAVTGAVAGAAVGPAFGMPQAQPPVVASMMSVGNGAFGAAFDLSLPSGPALAKLLLCALLVTMPLNHVNE